MFLLILDKDPIKSAEKVPDKIKFKQLLELCQLVSSVTNSVYKPINQGKELQHWVSEHKNWVKYYFDTLFQWCIHHIRLKTKTFEDFCSIYNSLGPKSNVTVPKTAIFRYSKGYICDIPSKTELNIDEAIREYEKYLQWKGEKWVKTK